jgi:hypothetical protein
MLAVGLARHIIGGHRMTVTSLAVKDPINRIFILDILSEINTHTHFLSMTQLKILGPFLRIC